MNFAIVGRAPSPKFLRRETVQKRLRDQAAGALAGAYEQHVKNAGRHTYPFSNRLSRERPSAFGFRSRSIYAIPLPENSEFGKAHQIRLKRIKSKPDLSSQRQHETHRLWTGIWLEG